MLQKIILCAEMSVALTSEHDSQLEVSNGVTMLVGDQTYNGRYFPVDEISKSLAMWEKIPVVLNHNEDIENVVGHLEGVTLTNNKLKAEKLIIDNYNKSNIARQYIKEQQRIGKVANVSISAWYEPSWETINGKENTLVARDLRPAHLGLVVHGACSPEQGCGIGLTKAGEDNSKTINIEIVSDENMKKSVNRLLLLDEINKRKARLKL